MSHSSSVNLLDFSYRQRDETFQNYIRSPSSISSILAFTDTHQTGPPEVSSATGEFMKNTSLIIPSHSGIDEFIGKRSLVPKSFNIRTAPEKIILPKAFMMIMHHLPVELVIQVLRYVAIEDILYFFVVNHSTSPRINVIVRSEFNHLVCQTIAQRFSLEANLIHHEGPHWPDYKVLHLSRLRTYQDAVNELVDQIFQTFKLTNENEVTRAFVYEGVLLYWRFRDAANSRDFPSFGWDYFSSLDHRRRGVILDFIAWLREKGMEIHMKTLDHKYILYWQWYRFANHEFAKSGITAKIMELWMLFALEGMIDNMEYPPHQAKSNMLRHFTWSACHTMTVRGHTASGEPCKIIDLLFGMQIVVVDRDVPDAYITLRTRDRYENFLSQVRYAAQLSADQAFTYAGFHEYESDWEVSRIDIGHYDAWLEDGETLGLEILYF